MCVSVCLSLLLSFLFFLFSDFLAFHHPRVEISPLTKAHLSLHGLPLGPGSARLPRPCPCVGLAVTRLLDSQLRESSGPKVPVRLQTCTASDCSAQHLQAWPTTPS